VVRKTKTGPSTTPTCWRAGQSRYRRKLSSIAASPSSGHVIDALQPGRPTHRPLHTTFTSRGCHRRLFPAIPICRTFPFAASWAIHPKAFVADPGTRSCRPTIRRFELRVAGAFSQDPGLFSMLLPRVRTSTAAPLPSLQRAARRGHSEQTPASPSHQLRLGLRQTDFGLAKPCVSRVPTQPYIERTSSRYARVRQYMDESHRRSARRTGGVSRCWGARDAAADSSRPAARNATTPSAWPQHAHPGSAADLLSGHDRVDREMVRFPDRGLLLTVHDELVFEVRPTRSRLLGLGQGVWSQPMPCAVPLVGRRARPAPTGARPTDGILLLLPAGTACHPWAVALLVRGPAHHLGCLPSSWMVCASGGRTAFPSKHLALHISSFFG